MTRTTRRNPYLLPEDGIIDEVAISRAVAGEGIPVSMTPAERDIAIRGIIRAGGGCIEVAASLGTSNGYAARLIKNLGYRLARSIDNVSVILGPVVAEGEIDAIATGGICFNA